VAARAELSRAAWGTSIPVWATSVRGAPLTLLLGHIHPVDLPQFTLAGFSRPRDWRKS
jgi:hypothetical protein